MRMESGYTSVVTLTKTKRNKTITTAEYGEQMKSLWNDEKAINIKSDLDLRVYTSRLLGESSFLVLHGGGNTSVKTSVKNFFGEEEEVLYVKGSGWDLATIEKEGFAPVKMETLLKMAKMDLLSDSDMVKYQRAAMLDPTAPNPSVEAILHAIIPFKFVDHTHADSVVAISNTENGEEKLKEIYGEKVLIIPYVMPGFDLAKLVYEATKEINWSELDAIILMNHGVFTFDNEAKASYENMIDIIIQAEKYLLKNGAMVCGDNIEEELSFFGAMGVFFSSFFTKTGKCFLGSSKKSGDVIELDLLELSKIRNRVSKEKKHAVIAKMNNSEKAVHFSNMESLEKIANQGPLTPDHVIRTKRLPWLMGSNVEESLSLYCEQYKEYFEQNKKEGLVCLNHAPNWAITNGFGSISFGKSAKEANIIQDITDHTMTAILKGELLGGYQALSAKEIFDVEYWELEQAKLKKGASCQEFAGKVVLITDALGDAQKICAKLLKDKGATIVAFDKNEEVIEVYNSSSELGLACDLSKQSEIQVAVEETIRNFGGIDIVINDIGTSIDKKNENSDHNWQKHLDINVTKHQNLKKEVLPYLKEGINPSIIIIASKEFISVGNEHVIYTAVENDQSELAMATTQELSSHGVRVNTIYPRKIHALSNEQTLQDRAELCGLSLDDYLAEDELKLDLEAYDTAILASTIASSAFGRTTGAQLKVDCSI